MVLIGLIAGYFIWTAGHPWYAIVTIIVCYLLDIYALAREERWLEERLLGSKEDCGCRRHRERLEEYGERDYDGLFDKIFR